MLSLCDPIPANRSRHFFAQILGQDRGSIFVQDKAVASPPFTSARNAGRNGRKRADCENLGTFLAKCDGSNFDDLSRVWLLTQRKSPRLSRFWWLRNGSFGASTIKNARKKFITRLSPETEQKLSAAFPVANCKSQNEFVERAICFYSDYVITQEATDFLGPMLVSALRATVQCSEDRIARLLFKQAVELSMMMNVLSIGLEIDDTQMDNLRWQCVQDVKKSNGSITFKDVVKKKNYGGLE